MPNALIAKLAAKQTLAFRDAIRSHSAELFKVLTHDKRPASVDLEY
jgi:hypothetical protein